MMYELTVKAIVDVESIGELILEQQKIVSRFYPMEISETKVHRIDVTEKKEPEEDQG